MMRIIDRLPLRLRWVLMWPLSVLIALLLGYVASLLIYEKPAIWWLGTSMPFIITTYTCSLVAIAPAKYGLVIKAAVTTVAALLTLVSLAVLYSHLLGYTVISLRSYAMAVGFSALGVLMVAASTRMRVTDQVWRGDLDATQVMMYNMTMFNKHVIAAILVGLGTFGLTVFGLYSLVTSASSPTADTAETSVTLAEVVPERTIANRGELYIGINQERVKAGLPTLTADPSLEATACAKAQDMIARNYWDHNAPDGTEPWHYFQLAGYSYINAGENLAYGYPSANAAVTGWMASPGHKANILGDYNRMGICVTNFADYQDGNYSLIVNHFATAQ